MGRILKNKHFHFALGGLLGFSLFTLTSHPKSPINRRLPQKKVKGVHFLPHIKLHIKDDVYHLHHWMILTLMYIPFFALRKKILKNKILHGFIVGSILQGLFYGDRFSLLLRE